MTEKPQRERERQGWIERLAAEEGRRYVDALQDYAWDLDEEFEDNKIGPWLRAVVEAYENGDNLDRLITLLDSAAPLPPRARWHIAELLRRRRLARRRGGQPNPHLDPSELRWRQKAAHDDWNKLDKSGLSQELEAAKAEILTAYGLTADDFANYTPLNPGV